MTRGLEVLALRKLVASLSKLLPEQNQQDRGNGTVEKGNAFIESSHGCLCDAAWRVEGMPACTSALNRGCCNPDGDEGGSWSTIEDIYLSCMVLVL